jgi:bla regulator protein BlaR1
MTRLFVECAIRAALIVIGTAIVLYAMRVKVAAVKHRVWTAVLVLMLVLPAWTTWGPKAQLRLLPASAERFARPPIVTPRLPDAATPKLSQTPPKIAQPRQPLFTTTEEIVLAIYFLGFGTLLARLIIGTAKANCLIRESALVERIMTSNACVSPVTVGCLRPTVILPAHWRKWSRQQLDVVLAHEGEHVRRRDPLVQWLALFNRAVFWFHPAAWWLERELSALAEEACDAAVIAGGHDPHDYAEILMSIARDVMDSGSRINSVAVAMPGPCLPHRIRTILNAEPSSRLSRAHGISLVVACTALCATLFAASLKRAQLTATEDWERAAGGKQSFEVASVKQTKSQPPPRTNVPLGSADVYPPNGGLFSATDWALSFYISFAYKLGGLQFQSVASQLPQWAHTERFDVQARGGGNPTKDQMRLMMQSLLVDRFKLKIHHETRQLPVYALVLDKPGRTGPQLRPFPDGFPCATSALPAPPGRGASLGPPTATIAGGFPFACGAIVAMQAIGTAPLFYRGARSVPMGLIVKQLELMGTLNRPLIDGTGLSGAFDFTFEWTPQDNPPVPPGAGPEPDDSGPTFSEALKDQLGLKLESTTGPVDTIVIDHIEEPSPN